MAPRTTRRTIRRRQAAALLVAVAATAGIWAAFVRGGGREGPPPAGGSSAGVSAPVASLVRRMTPDELVDQVLLLGFEGTDATSPAIDELRARQLGGVLVRASNWTDPGQGALLIAALRAAGLAGHRIPPMIVTAQEGGAYRTLDGMPPRERELDIGRTGSAQAAERWSRQTGQALRAVGVDLNLSPVADVTTLVSPVADRAFSDDAALAAQLTAAAVRGCAKAKIACAVLHFPGLGGASQDTNAGPATVSLDAETLTQRDLAAFRAAFAERVPAVVLSLAFYAAFDPVTPAATSRPVATGLLRDKLRYTGLAITDDLGAGAIKATSSPPAAAVAALEAGADMVQIGSPADQAGVREAILRALESGELPVERLQQAAARVLQLKRQVGLLKGNLK